MPRRSRPQAQSRPERPLTRGPSKEAAWKRLVEVTSKKLSAEEREICAILGLTEAQFQSLLSRILTRMALDRKLFGGSRPPGKTAAVQPVPAEGPILDVDRIVPVVAHAVAVFGDEHKASHWLSTPLALLDNLSPARAMARKDGVEEVDRVLTRIEHNIPS